MAEIRSKKQFYELWRAGLLGNRPRTWLDVEEAYAASCPRYGIREQGRAGGGKFEVVPRSELLERIQVWVREKRTFILDDGAPNELVQLQGEVTRTEHGLEGVMAIRSGLNMREAAARGLLLPVRGLRANLLLDHFLCPNSREDLGKIMDAYPDAVVEFAAFPSFVGVLPRRNTLIWEVRNY